MCINCGDWIDMCGQDECLNPNAGRYGKFKSFYIGAKYCRHLKEQYGHDYAEWGDRYKDEDEDEE